MNKAQKLVRMLELMSRMGGTRADDLMERFDLDPRSLRRYLADLRELDLPLRDEGKGEGRVLSIDPRWRRTGVRLSLAEVLSLHFGRKLFNFLDGTRFAEDLDGAIERLQPAISRTHSDLARQLDTKFLAVPEPTKDFADTGELIDEVVTALVYSNPVEARYRKANGVESHYVLNPYTLATFRQGLYLFAYDRKANLVKTYAMERFVDIVRQRKETFEMPNGWRPDAHLANAFGIISGPAVPVVIAFTPQVTAYVRERTWHPTQTYRTLPDGRLELRMQVAATIELITWLLGFGADAELLEPPELRQRVQQTLHRAIRAYESPAS